MKKSKAPSVEISKEINIDGAFLHSNLVRWYEQHERPLPWRVLWKKYRNPWHIWVSEIMLQQTVIKAVMPVYDRFLNQFPSVNSLAMASTEDVRLAVRGLGYYRRFDFLHRASKQIVAEAKGMPQNHDQWLMLPGIGAYTAAAISSITTDAPYGVVDGNVERVLCRFLDIRLPGNTPSLKKSFKEQMDAICKRGQSGKFNQAMMELGQSHCSPSTPTCKSCPIQKKCKSFQNSSQHLAPAPKLKQEHIDVKLRLNISHSQKGIHLTRRSETAKFLKGTWGFKTYIDKGKSWHQDGINQNKWAKADSLVRIGQIKHNITKHKINAEVYSLPEVLNTKDENQKLFKIKDVEENLVSNLDRKAWALFLKS